MWQGICPQARQATVPLGLLRLTLGPESGRRRSQARAPESRASSRSGLAFRRSRNRATSPSPASTEFRTMPSGSGSRSTSGSSSSYGLRQISPRLRRVVHPRAIGLADPRDVTGSFDDVSVRIDQDDSEPCHSRGVLTARREPSAAPGRWQPPLPTSEAGHRDVEQLVASRANPNEIHLPEPVAPVCPDRSRPLTTIVPLGETETSSTVMAVEKCGQRTSATIDANPPRGRPLAPRPDGGALRFRG